MQFNVSSCISHQSIISSLRTLSCVDNRRKWTCNRHFRSIFMLLKRSEKHSDSQIIFHSRKMTRWWLRNRFWKIYAMFAVASSCEENIFLPCLNFYAFAMKWILLMRICMKRVSERTHRADIHSIHSEGEVNPSAWKIIPSEKMRWRSKLWFFRLLWEFLECDLLFHALMNSTSSKWNGIRLPIVMLMGKVLRW